MTEIIQGWVAYDAQCGFCSAWAGRTHELLASRGFHLVPLQAPWVKAHLGLNQNELPAEMKLLAADGAVSGGADAMLAIARRIWWAWPLFIISLLPGVTPALRSVYRRAARHRHCLGGKCEVSSVQPEHHRHGASAFYEIP
jgi:predicted DCC family thiol-disulfide oxidoreductase YuxK